jgi:NAD(P)-dependent dehydrogenase (short-subunit alcohol dehydrogenase family)
MNIREGQVAVVTGAARGIGFGLASAFAEEGLRVVLADIDEPALEGAVASLREAGAEAIGVPTDITRPDALARLRDRTFEQFGTVHVLCNNGGPGISDPLDRPIDVERWKHIMDLLVYSVLYGINAFLPQMLEQGEGHIVNTSSGAGLTPVRQFGAYSPAKSAVLSLSEVLHGNLADRGAPVGVSVITPSFVRTENAVAGIEAAEQDPDADPAILDFMRAGMVRAVDPIDVGRLTIRAIRDNALYINTHRERLEGIQARVDGMVADADRIGTLM